MVESDTPRSWCTATTDNTPTRTCILEMRLIKYSALNGVGTEVSGPDDDTPSVGVFGIKEIRWQCFGGAVSARCVYYCFARVKVKRTPT